MCSSIGSPLSPSRRYACASRESSLLQVVPCLPWVLVRTLSHSPPGSHSNTARATSHPRETVIVRSVIVQLELESNQRKATYHAALGTTGVAYASMFRGSDAASTVMEQLASSAVAPMAKLCVLFPIVAHVLRGIRHAVRKKLEEGPLALQKLFG